MNKAVHELKAHPKNIEIYGNETLPESFITSVSEKGVMVPVIIKEDGTIISGHRRWQAAKQTGIDSVPVGVASFDSELDELQALIDFNQQREKTFSQKMREAEQLERIEAERATERQELGNNQHRVVEKFPQGSNGKTRDKVGKRVGIGSGRTYDKSKDLWEKAKTDENVKELVSDIDSGKKSISGAYKEIKKQEKKKERKQHIESQKKEIENREYESPQDKKYQAIIIDPPWNYGRDYDPDGSRVANPYPEMPQSELKQLALPADDNCMLYLWTTHQFIWDAKELIDYWGFDYKATLVWNKQKIGMGYWVRMQCEFCLVAVKGKPIWENTTWRDIINESRREHSRKPEKFYEFVRENTVGNIYEFFSRTERKGIDSHGNDKNKFSDDLVG